MIGDPPPFSIPVKLKLSNPLIDLTKLKLVKGRIHYFLYQQDGTKRPMSCVDTHANRLCVAWMQIHDSPLTGNSVEERERKNES